MDRPWQPRAITPFSFIAARASHPLRLRQVQRVAFGFIRKRATSCAPCPLRYAQRGSVLSIVAILSVFLIGFLGIAVYTGLNMYVQGELSNVTSLASGVGAAAFYDKFDAQGLPVKSPDRAQTAVQDTFTHLVDANPALQGFNAQIVGGAPGIDSDRETVRLETTATIPTPMLAPIGINNYQLTAVSLSRYARRHLFPAPYSLGSASAPGYVIKTLNPPLLDDPGPDLYISVAPSVGTGYHGVLIEACSAGRCYDLGPAARQADATSAVVDRQYQGGVTRRVLYGNFFIDLGAVNATLGYNKSVKKATMIRILDDGFNDYIVPDGSGKRGMEFPPAVLPAPPTPIFPDTIVQSTQVLHNAVYCPATGGCIPPAGYQFTPVP